MALFRLPLLLLLLLLPAPRVYAVASPHDYSPGIAAASPHVYSPGSASASSHDYSPGSASASSHDYSPGSTTTTARVNLVPEREPSASGAEKVGSDYESVAAAPPPHPLLAARELASQLLPPQAEGSVSATAASPLNDPAAATTALLPLVNPRPSVAPPIQAGAAGVVASDGEEGLQRLAWVLTSLDYNEMPSTKAPLARWPGAITVFAAPDIVFQASCPRCSRRYLLLEHIAIRATVPCAHRLQPAGPLSYTVPQ